MTRTEALNLKIGDVVYYIGHTNYLNAEGEIVGLFNRDTNCVKCSFGFERRDNYRITDISLTPRFRSSDEKFNKNKEKTNMRLESVFLTSSEIMGNGEEYIFESSVLKSFHDKEIPVFWGNGWNEHIGTAKIVYIENEHVCNAIIKLDIATERSISLINLSLFKVGAHISDICTNSIGNGRLMITSGKLERLNIAADSHQDRKSGSITICYDIPKNVEEEKPHVRSSDENSQNVCRESDSKKFDGEKPMMHLIPTSYIQSGGRVLTYGANKYKPNGWKEVEPERYVSALIRHLLAYMDDPNGIDEESGLYHSEHILTNAMFLNHFTVDGKI